MISTSHASTQVADPQWKQDVFLSFRGTDTREGITSMLYDELVNRLIKTFKDDRDLEVGMAISPTLLRAIEESRFAIVVLSPDYASSTWCLEELKKIVQCMEEDRILPLYYQVDPSDVRNQTETFGIAFTKHEKSSRHTKEKVQEWRDALSIVAKLTNKWESKDYEFEEELVKEIVEFMCSKVQPIEFDHESIGFEAFTATRRSMSEVMQALKDDEASIIGVYGMGGVGKTTMVTHIGAQAKRDGLFDQVIMAVVSQNPNLMKIQNTLADMLHLKMKEVSAGGRAIALKNTLMSRNKILIILDDVWNNIDLSSIGIPSPEELPKCNCKILFTTRRRNVCHAMESQAETHLHVLSERDAWSLFVKKTRKSFHESTEFFNVARAVARECAGLPLALIAVSKALGDKDLNEWKEAARRLKASQPANPEDERDVFKCIKLSYDYLRPDDTNIAKSLFLLCCLFPEDDNIVVEDLLMYSIGKGLFQDAYTINEARAIAHSVAKYLIASSLLLGSEYNGCVRMHDVVRDVAISISLSEDGPGFLVKAGCELKDWPEINVQEGYTAISLMRNHIEELPEKLVCSKLKILLLQHNAIYEIPKTFLQSRNELMVLDLRDTRISFLPKSFKHLINLQALHLDDWEDIEDISIVGKLKKLEILSIRGSFIVELPKELGELKNMKMFDITNSKFEIVPYNVISKWKRLEELYMKCYFWEWGSKLEGWCNCTGFLPSASGKSADFDEVTGLSRLNNLEARIYDVECLPREVRFNPNWINFDICIKRYKVRTTYFESLFKGSRSDKRDLRELPFRHVTLDTTMDTLPDWFITVVTEKADILEYNECMSLDNILIEHECGRLSGLKYLAVFECLDLEVLMNSRTWVPNNPVFQSLEELYLTAANSLRELCVGELPPESLCNLTLLIVRHCPELVNALLPSNLLPLLRNLEILDCMCMEQMEHVFGFEDLKPHQIVLTKLKDVTLFDIENLTSIWNGPAPNGIFDNLKSLAIRDCNKLKHLLTSDVAIGLSQLELLWVESCAGMESVFEPSEINKIVIPKLKDIHLKRLAKLTRLYSCSIGCSNYTDCVECPSLKHLYVDDCPRFSTSLSVFRLHDDPHSNSPFERLYRRKLSRVPEV